MSDTAWVVHKFGGTSVANAERYQGVARVLEAEPGARKGVVVSAMSKVTDTLIEVVTLAQSRDEAYKARLQALRAKHLEAARDLLPQAAAAQAELVAVIESDFRDLEEILRGIWLARTESERSTELISGYGEIWSAQLLAAYLKSQGKPATWLDARKVLTVTPTSTSVIIDWERSRKQLESWLSESGLGGRASEVTVVITGFIASTPEGIPTTLKRNGSDYSASIFGALLKASAITIWTDVDGVLSADPRLVPEAVVLDELTYAEASELAYFGAKVVHPSTMAPAIQDGIPIWIRNTFNPTYKGSLIHGGSSRSDKTIKGFATIDEMALFNVEGTGMVGVPGIAQRLFGALREVGVSVVMISQASSEHSICFAIPRRQTGTARQAIEQAFYAELHQGQIQTVSVVEPASILAAVGDNMVSAPGVAGRFFGALGKAGVNVLAIAQGSSERNISAVIHQAQARKALRAVHSGFFLSAQTLSIGVIGTGLIGSTLLDQLRDQARRLRDEFSIDLRVRGLASSTRMALGEPQISLGEWREALGAAKADLDLEAFAAHVQAEHLPHAVLIDATASAEVATRYADWLGRGIHVISPNKQANTSTMADYRAIRAAARATRRQFLYETNVGAGLPIINTLRDLVLTGDRIDRIEGVFSGTLSYLFNNFDGRTPFSDIVRDAKSKGYTEPDPRDDLSGMDVARKLVILCREMGLEIELSQIRVESLVPESLQGLGLDEFLKRLPELDAPMARRLEAARAQGRSLRYVGVIPLDRKPFVELRAYPAEHAFARVRGSDNIVGFTTGRYATQPLIVQGPGAGPEVTAAGVFADLLRLGFDVGWRMSAARAAPPSSATAFAPATVANVAVGFDLLGFPVEGVGDTVTVSRAGPPGVTVEVHGLALPLDPARNTATVGLLELVRDRKLPHGFHVAIRKGIDVGSGMGGSAASACGAIVAASALLEEPLAPAQLLDYALLGEAVASGSRHTDNVAPCLFGGLVFTQGSHVARIPVPARILCVLVHPRIVVETKSARGILKAYVALKDHVRQSRNLAGLIAGCHAEDLGLVRDSFQDILIEPQRAHLIPGFAGARQAALDEGALGFAISGSGPSVFAWVDGQSRAQGVQRAILAAFGAAGLECDAWISPISRTGTRLQ